MFNLKDVYFGCDKCNKEKVIEDIYFDNWCILLEFKGKRFTTNYFMGKGHKGKPPSKKLVLHTLQSDCLLEQDSFEVYCDCIGGNSDSIKELENYKAIIRQTLKLKKLFGENFDDFLDFNFEG
jgi:hypothetical protein